MIEKLRGRIDEIDRKILSLLNERIETANAIGEEKKKLGLPIEDEERERKVLDQLQNRNDGPLPDSSVRKIFTTVIEETKRTEGEVTSNDCCDETGS